MELPCWLELVVRVGSKAGIGVMAVSRVCSWTELERLRGGVPMTQERAGRTGVDGDKYVAFLLVFVRQLHGDCVSAAQGQCGARHGSMSHFTCSWVRRMCSPMPMQESYVAVCLFVTVNSGRGYGKG